MIPLFPVDRQYFRYAANGQLGEMNWCLQKGGANPYARDQEGRIFEEVILHNPSVIQPLFVEKGFNALHFACRKQQNLVSGELLEKYPDLTNLPDNKGLTPLFYFFKQDPISPETFEAFASSGTRFDRRYDIGWTPLDSLARDSKYFVYLQRVVLGTVKKVQEALRE